MASTKLKIAALPVIQSTLNFKAMLIRKLNSRWSKYFAEFRNY